MSGRQPGDLAGPGAFGVLGRGDFRRYFAGQTVALLGGWMQAVAQNWLVLDLTGSPVRLGLLSVLHFAPMLVLGLPAGALVDRLPKRRLLVVTTLLQAFQAVVLATLAWAGAIQYWHVAVLALGWGLVTTLESAARHAYVVELVGRDDVVHAVSLHAAAFNTARLVGPSVAGLLMARWGVAPAFTANAAALCLAAVALAGLRADGRPAPGARRRVLAEIGEAVGWVLAAPRLVYVLALLAVVSMTAFNFAIWVPLVARNVLGLGARGFGFLMASVGAGAVVGALSLGLIVGREPPVRRLGAAAALTCTTLVALGFARDAVGSVLGFVLLGGTAVVTITGSSTVLQLAAPDALRGRVMALFGLVHGGLFPIGALAVGALAEAWGVSAAFLVAGAAGLIAIGLASAWAARRGVL